MRKFWEIIYDDSKRTIEVIRSSTDDTLLTSNISEMQQAGMQVRCSTGDISIPKEDVKVAGYIKEDDLYSRLLREYEALTKKKLKRW